jgi:hypothetical protein
MQTLERARRRDVLRRRFLPGWPEHFPAALARQFRLVSEDLMHFAGRPVPRVCRRRDLAHLQLRTLSDKGAIGAAALPRGVAADLNRIELHGDGSTARLSETLGDAEI